MQLRRPVAYMIFFPLNHSTKFDFTGETFMFFSEQMKGNGTELIQSGLPTFNYIEEDTTDGARSKSTRIFNGIIV